MLRERNRSKSKLPPTYSTAKIDPDELAKYAGKWVAIWEDKIIGTGKNEKEAYEDALKNEPEAKPTICGIESGDYII
jgi:hypothetical protein